MIDGSPLPYTKFRWLLGSSEVCLSDSASATQLCRRFYQCVICVCRCPDACRLFRTSPAACWCCSSFNLCSETLLWTAERCDLYILADFWLKFCLLYWAASKLPRLLDTVSKFALFSVSDLKDEKLVKSKPTWKPKHANNSILESFEYFWQTPSKSFFTISSYTILKLGLFLIHSVFSVCFAV